MSATESLQSLTMSQVNDTTYCDLSSVTRDPQDGAYHCPSCQAPFTRKSNLRRHFTIHTRIAPFMCTACKMKFAHSDEFHYHILQCTESQSQSVQTGEPFPHQSDFSVTPESLTTPGTPSSTLYDINSTNLLPMANANGDGFDQTLFDFLSSLEPTPDATPSLDFQHNAGTLDANTLFTNPTLPTPPASSQQRGPRSNQLQSRRSSKPYGGIRSKNQEQPVYTRRQVDDMLDAMTNCFVETFEEVRRRTGIDMTTQQNFNLAPLLSSAHVGLGHQGDP